MNYTRKRALLACDFCRHRKRRCDGERPCSTCRESNADCRYKDLPVERVEPSPGSGEAVTEQLNRIEVLLHRLVHTSAGGVSEGPETSKLMMTHPLTENSGSYTTSPPVSDFIYDQYSQDLLTDFADYTDYTQTPLPYSHDSIITSTSTSGCTTSAPIISLSLAPPAVPLVSTMPVSQMTSTPLLSMAPASLTPVHPVSPVSQPRTFASRLSPDHAFSPAYHSRYSLVTSTPAVSPSESSPFQHTAQLQQKQYHQQETQLVIPREESTAADSLLSMPEIEFLISRSWNTNNSKNDTSKTSKTNDINDIKSARGDAPVPAQLSPDLPLSRTHFYDIEVRLPLQKELHPFYSPGPWDSTWPLPITDPARTDKISGYVSAYFTFVYPNTPLVNIGQYAELSRGLFDAGEADKDLFKSSSPDNDASIQKAICLTIWAIGALVSAGANDKDPERDALLYFQPAFKIIQHHALCEVGPPSLASCQALLLAASYFAHIGRPLYNARMVHLAGCQLLKLYQQKARGGYDAERQRDFRIAFWVCFLWESDRVAEFDVPLSGIIELSADMPLPNQGETDDSETMIYLTAEIAARKISNQTRDCLYGPPLPITAAAAAPPPPPMGDVDMADALTSAQPHKRRRGGDDGLFATTPSSISLAASSKPHASGAATIHKLLSDSTELNRQLDEWYRMIPEHVQPPLQGNVVYSGAATHRTSQGGQNSQKGQKSQKSRSDRNSPSSDPVEMKLLPLRARILRAQYYAIRHIIHRPFVLAVAWHQKQNDEVRERRKLNSTNGAKRNRLPQDEIRYLPPAILEKCAICVDSCLMFLIHVLPLLDQRSPYLWSFCQTSVACLVVLLVVQACPPMHATNAARHAFEGGKSRRVSIARLRDQVAKKLSRWATEGSSFQAELHLVQSLPVPASDSIIFMIPAGLAGSPSRDLRHSGARHGPIKRE